MKATIEIDCTPEEARRALGLPDLTPIHDRYVATMLDAMDGVMKPELIESTIRGWAPMGEAGLAMWRRLFDVAAPKPYTENATRRRDQPR